MNVHTFFLLSPKVERGVSEAGEPIYDMPVIPKQMMVTRSIQVTITSNSTLAIKPSPQQ
jgi:hypothetical protein